MNIIRKLKLNSLGYYEFEDSEKILVFIKNTFFNLTSIIIETENKYRVVYY